MGDTGVLKRTRCSMLKTMCRPVRAGVVAAPVPRAAALGLHMPLLQSYSRHTTIKRIFSCDDRNTNFNLRFFTSRSFHGMGPASLRNFGWLSYHEPLPMS